MRPAAVCYVEGKKYSLHKFITKSGYLVNCVEYGWKDDEGCLRTMRDYPPFFKRVEEAKMAAIEFSHRHKMQITHDWVSLIFFEAAVIKSLEEKK